MRLNPLLIACGSLEPPGLFRLARKAGPAVAAFGCQAGNVPGGDKVEAICEGCARRGRTQGPNLPVACTARCIEVRPADDRERRALPKTTREAREMRLSEEGHDRCGRAVIWPDLDGRAVATAMNASGDVRVEDGGPSGGWC